VRFHQNVVSLLFQQPKTTWAKIVKIKLIGQMIFKKVVDLLGVINLDSLDKEAQNGVLLFKQNTHILYRASL